MPSHPKATGQAGRGAREAQSLMCLPTSHLSRLALKWGSGNRKNIFVSCPLRKKFGRYFIALVRITPAFW